jgi:hypothetical protein
VKLWDIIVYRHFWEWNKLFLQQGRKRERPWNRLLRTIPFFKNKDEGTLQCDNLYFSHLVRRPQKASDLPPNDCPAASCA